MNATTATLAIFLLKMLQPLVAGFADLETKLNELAAAIKAKGNVTDADLQAAFAASAQAHSDVQGA